jgi:hypothetical protein
MRQKLMDHDPVPEGYPLRILGDHLAVCRLPPEAEIPEWARPGELLVITRTPAELSIVCSQRFVPPHIKAERDWRAFEVIGPLDFNLVGVLAALSTTLAEAGISIFALSTYDTDYLLVRMVDFERACAALNAAGHSLVA